MKKLLFTLFATLFAITAFADGIKVSEGNANYIKTKGTMSVVFDWADAKWNNEKPLKEQLGDSYQKYVENGQKAFIEGYNKSSKKIKIEQDSPSVNYVMTVKFTNFDKFFSAMSLVPGHKHKVWAEITVTDKNSGNVLCKYKVEEYKGDRDFSIDDSFTKMLRGLGEDIAKKK